MAATPTWAQVARKKKPLPFLPTECAVNLEQFAAPQRLPPSSSPHSAFIPLPSGYTQKWAMDIVTALPPSVKGLIPRADIFLLEVCFETAEAQQDFLDTPFVCKHFTVHPLPPAGTPPTYLPIKLVNVPVLSVAAIEQQLCTFWSAHGAVVAIAPHLYKGLMLLTNCWNIVLKLPAGTLLAASPFFDLLGFKVMASWPGSDKACPRCKLVGHDSHTCPCRPASKTQKKHSSATSKQPATTQPAPTQSSSSVDATADTADKDTLTSNLTLDAPERQHRTPKSVASF